MKRSRRQRCAVYGSPGARRFACMSPQELDAARRRGLAYDATPEVEYGSAEECAERCNALLALPVPQRGDIAALLQYPELQRFEEAVPTAGLGLSQAVLESERRACDELDLPFLPWPPGDADAVRTACGRWRLPCARPCAELLERVRRPPLRLSARPGQPFVSVIQERPSLAWYSTVLTITDAGAAARAFPGNEAYLAGRDWTRARRLPGAQTLPVLLPGDSVLFDGIPGGGGGGRVRWGMVPDTYSFSLVSNPATNAPRIRVRLTELVLESGTGAGAEAEEEEEEEASLRTVDVWYDVPLPQGVDPEALLGTYGRQPLAEAARAMTDAVAMMFSIDVQYRVYVYANGRA